MRPFFGNDRELIALLAMLLLSAALLLAPARDASEPLGIRLSLPGSGRLVR